MSHEHETPDAGAAVKPGSAGDRPRDEGGANAVEDPAREPEPDYIARARRILGGDVRPDDYLPMTPEVEEGVERDLAGMRDDIRKDVEAGRIPAMFDLDPCVAIGQRNMRLLSVHYSGQIIAAREDDRGVIVFAVGLDNAAALMRVFPYEQRRGVGFYSPDSLDALWV